MMFSFQIALAVLIISTVILMTAADCSCHADDEADGGAAKKQGGCCG